MRRLLLLFGACTLIISCNNSSNNNAASTKDSAAAKPTVTANAKSTLSDAGTQKLMSMLTDYYGLKNAMFAVNAGQVDSFANRLSNSAKEMKAFAEKDSAAKTIIPHLDTMTTELQQLAAVQDPKCQKQQLPFSKVSDQLFAVLKEADVKNTNIYLQHCPMALEEKGAHWLSNEAEIKNPYFPKTMNDCGDLEDSLK